MAPSHHEHAAGGHGLHVRGAVCPSPFVGEGQYCRAVVPIVSLYYSSWLSNGERSGGLSRCSIPVELYAWEQLREGSPAACVITVAVWPVGHMMRGSSLVNW